MKSSKVALPFLSARWPVIMEGERDLLLGKRLFGVAVEKGTTAPGPAIPWDAGGGTAWRAGRGKTGSLYISSSPTSEHTGPDCYRGLCAWDWTPDRDSRHRLDGWDTDADRRPSVVLSMPSGPESGKGKKGFSLSGTRRPGR